MKRILKIFAAVAVLALAIGSVFALTALAQETKKPEIVSANIAYEGDYAILLAIDAATVSGDSVSVKVWDNNGKLLGTYSDSDNSAEANANIGNSTYYIIKTPGISHKNMDKVYTYQAIDAEGNEGAAAKLSVAEYFYSRLFINGIADATEGADAVRRDFYLDALEHGAKAQNLLYNYNDKDDDNVTVFVDDLLYANIEGYTFDNGYSTEFFDNSTTKITLPATNNYIVTKYAKDTLEKSVSTAAAGSEITIDAHTVIKIDADTPVIPDNFVAGQGEYYNNAEISGNRFDYYAANGNLRTDGIGEGDSYDISTGALTFTRGGTADSYVRFNHSGFKGTEREPIFVFETDFMFDGYTANELGEDGRFGRFDFRANGVMIEIPITADSYTAGEEINTVKFGAISLNASRWYNIRFVVSYGEEITLTYYVNGAESGSETVTTKSTTAKMSGWYFEEEQTAGVMNFDNTLVACYDANPIIGGEYFNNTEIEGIRYSDADLLSGVQSSSLSSDTLEMVNGKLVFTRNATSAGTSTYFRYLHDGVTKTKLVFEADITFADIAVSSGYRPIYIRIAGNDLRMDVEVQNSGDQVLMRSASGTYAQLNKGTKYNLRFVIDYTTNKIDYYVDGTLIRTDSPSSSTAAKGSNFVRFDFDGTANAGSITLDNIFIGSIGEEVVEVEGGKYFADTTITGTRVDGDDLVNSANNQGSVALSDVLKMDNGKAVFTRDANTTETTLFRYIHSSGTEGLETPVMVYEADMKIDALNPQGSTVGYIRLAGNNVRLDLQIQYWGTSLYIFHNGSGNGLTLTVGQEYNLRFEIDYANSKVNYYVDDTFTKSENVSLTGAEGSKFVRYDLTGTSGTITLDNVFIGMVEDGTAN